MVPSSFRILTREVNCRRIKEEFSRGKSQCTVTVREMKTSSWKVTHLFDDELAFAVRHGVVENQKRPTKARPNLR